MNRRAYEKGREDALSCAPMDPALETGRLNDRALRAYARAYRRGYRDGISERNGKHCKKRPLDIPVAC